MAKKPEARQEQLEPMRGAVEQKAEDARAWSEEGSIIAADASRSS